MKTITTSRTNYKSYSMKYFSIRVPNGNDPQAVTVKVFNTKKPKAEVSVGIGWFSESRGYGGQSQKKITITDPNVVALCRACLTDDSGISPLIDNINEGKSVTTVDDRVKALLNRWWVLAQQENPTAFIDTERKQRAFEDKKFSVGETVIYIPRHEYIPQTVTITQERFEWGWDGGGWRFSFPGAEAEQSRFRKIEEKTVAS